MNSTSVVFLLDLVGTVAFAVSGAFVGFHGRMDVFGVIVLSIATACGEGLLRDLVVDAHPPLMFTSSVFLAVAVLTALFTFLMLYRHARLSRGTRHFYAGIYFWFDTLGLAVFTVDGVNVGMAHGYADNLLLLTFLGVLTGVGGGAIRDVLARRVPDVLIRDVYATASISGAAVMAAMVRYGCSPQWSMVAGFLLVVVLRVLAVRFRWNLPRPNLRKSPNAPIQGKDIKGR